MNLYADLPEYRHVALEESYVLGITITPYRLDFQLELVVKREHPLFREPCGGEVYSPVHGTLRFDPLKEISWESGGLPAIDADGSKDYGNLEVLAWGGSYYRFEGGFGTIKLRANRPTLIYHD